MNLTSPKNKGGRPRISDAEKARRGTLKPSRSRDGPVSEPAGSIPEEQDYIAVSHQYVADVLAGRVVACQWVRLACERQLRDLAKGQADPTWPYVWSETDASEACAFLERLPHVEGKWATETIRLEPSQVFLVTCLFGWRQRADSALRRFTVVYYELGRKGAKALALDTMIPTPTGFTAMGDLRVGDQVLCSDGRQTRITALSPVMIGQTCYEVEFSTGERIVADAGHLWLTSARTLQPGKRSRRGIPRHGRQRYRPILRTTEEIARTLTRGARRDRNHSIAVAAPLVLPEADLPINPYALGVWLGDGHSAAGRFTSADPEVVAAVEAAEGEVREFARRGVAASYRIGRSYHVGQPKAETFQGRLRTLGVLNNKHIPPEYLRASIEQRRALLQGLMDTDGTADTRGHLTFVSTRQVLADDVAELVASLGMKPTRQSKDAAIYGRVVGTAYTVQFYADVPVFRIARKRDRQRTPGPTARSRTRQIVSVRQVPSVPVRCITVDSPDGMFLVGRSFIPTHNSTLTAGLALYHLLREQEPGASVVCGASTGSQARIVFGIMQRMVRRASWLRAEGVQALANAIITQDGNAKPINAKASTQDGLNPSCIVLDESHAQTFALHDVLKSAQGGRTNPLLLAPTTAGYNLLSVGYALRTTITKVLQGTFVSEHFLGLIYTLDDGDDWRDERVWRKANPMLGVTPKIPWVRQYCTDAQQTTGLEGEFRVKVCSQWLQSASAWLSMSHWDACADPTLTLETFKGQRAWIGGDLAQLDDIAALAAIFERGSELCAVVRFYLPAHVVDERARAVPEYRAWVTSGLLHVTDGNMIDYRRIEADIRAWCKLFNVAAIRLDQFGSAHIVSALAEDGFPAAILDKNAKNFTPPARELETRLKHRRFRHDGNSCLKWMASNCVVTRRTDDSILPKKDHPESPNKIDGIDAILQAMTAWLMPAERPQRFQMLVLGSR